METIRKAVPGSLKRQKGFRGGFTLFEVLVVLFLISISIALVSPSLRSGLAGFRVKAASRMTAAFLRSARSRALTERRQFTVVPLEKALLMKGGEGKVEKEMNLPDGVRIKAAEGLILDFFPGGNSSGGEIEVTDGAKNAAVVRVEDSGLITMKNGRDDIIKP